MTNPFGSVWRKLTLLVIGPATVFALAVLFNITDVSTYTPTDGYVRTVEERWVR